MPLLVKKEAIAWLDVSTVSVLCGVNVSSSGVEFSCLLLLAWTKLMPGIGE